MGTSNVKAIWRGAALALSLAAPGALAVPAAGPAPPRPLSEAEREAVRLAADYLARGPAAFQEALASSSPLRTLTPAAARDEIEVRAGVRGDVSWELQTPDRNAPGDLAVFSIEAPSGLDDTLLLRMVKEKEGWRIVWLRSYHEPWRDGRAEARKEEGETARLSIPKLVVVAAAGGLAAALLLLVGISFLPEKPLIAARWALPGLAVLAGTVFVLSGRLPVRGLSFRAPELLAKLRRGTDVERLASLLSLRRKLEAGEPRETAACLALALQNPQPMAQLWIAQRLLAAGALPEARRVLNGVKRDPPVPWSAVLRARMAFFEKKETDAAAAYETASTQGILHDGLLLEAIAISRALGAEIPDPAQQQKLWAFGARSANARLALATGLARDEKREQAEAALLGAWRERPLDREVLLGEGDLDELLHRPAVLDLLQLSAPDEPFVASDEVGRRAIELPPGAVARVCGRSLRVTLGLSQLQVPGGAELAPPGTPAEDAGAERRALEARALADVPALTADPPRVGAFVQPVSRGRVLRTCFVLARKNRWQDLVAVTSRLSGKDEQVPAELLMLRAQALRRLGRTEDARELLVELGDSPGFAKRNDPIEQYELGELFAGLEEYDRGIRFLEKAAARLKREALLDRVVQVKTERGLAARFASSISPHFEVRFPPERRDGFGEEALRVLEAERKRLAKWLPASERRTTVQILWLQEFRRTYGASGDVLGLYDGKIRVPLGGVGRFGAFAVSIVTHELAHALISDMTKDNAPRWFHEGLAQHLEMRRSRPNDIVQYEKDRSLLSLPVVEMVLTRMPDPYFVEQAYEESAWAVAYLDARWGTAGLSRLMGAYRDGLAGDDALQKAVGVSLAQLSREFVAWSLQQPKVLHDEIVAYDDAPDDSFHWANDPKAPLGARKPAEIPESLTN
jgi:tetratricopeptide (TPR) repeat protein